MYASLHLQNGQIVLCSQTLAPARVYLHGKNLIWLHNAMTCCTTGYPVVQLDNYLASNDMPCKT